MSYFDVNKNAPPIRDRNRTLAKGSLSGFVDGIGMPVTSPMGEDDLLDWASGGTTVQTTMATAQAKTMLDKIVDLFGGSAKSAPSVTSSPAIVGPAATPAASNARTYAMIGIGAVAAYLIFKKK